MLKTQRVPWSLKINCKHLEKKKKKTEYNTLLMITSCRGIHCMDWWRWWDREINDAWTRDDALETGSWPIWLQNCYRAIALISGRISIWDKMTIALSLERIPISMKRKTQLKIKISLIISLSYFNIPKKYISNKHLLSTWQK